MRQTVAAVVLAASVSASASCSGDEERQPPTTVTSPASVAPSSTADATVAEVLDTYASYWAARVEAQADPTKALPKGLTRYGTGAAVSDVRATVLLFRQQGIQMRGRPRLDPKVVDQQATSATVTDCIDSTDWTPVYAETGKSALAPDQPARSVMTAQATKDGSRWQIETAVIDRDRRC